jgi:UDP-3-O-[3-hydroxymyristoyl] N-acetylglucosamine deacetylase
MGRYVEQTTIARPVTKRGIGLHTGAGCVVTLQPAERDAGVVFATESGAIIPATPDQVLETQRGTTLGAGGARVGCVEHLMAALYGLAVDNVRAEVTGPELPACDGSAREWVELVQEAGIAPLGAARPTGRLSGPIWAGDDAGGAVAIPGGRGLALAVRVEYQGTVAAAQSLWLRLTPRRFAKGLAPARTFVMERELQSLREAGFAKGGSEANAFVVGPGGYSGPLRFEDEVVRHKALDVVGDLALCGWRFDGVVVALRPSHRVNVALARALRAHLAAAPAREEAVSCLAGQQHRCSAEQQRRG